MPQGSESRSANNALPRHSRSKRRRQAKLARQLFQPVIESLEERLPLDGQVFEVINTNDSGGGSLRQAILNANATNGPDSIAFNLPGGGPYSIQPLSPLPIITDAVTLDGTTQPGFAGRPIIELNGSNAGASVPGLRITAGGTTVRGLVVNRFNGHGILITAGANSIIAGNFIGTDVFGAIDLGNGANGVEVAGGAIDTVIGTNGDGIGDAAEGNLISGNDRHGVWIVGEGVDRTIVAGNIIGLNAAGTAAIGNYGVSVGVVAGPEDTRLGTDGDGVSDAEERNVLSGNRYEVLVEGATTARTVIAGNYIGTNAAGNAGIPNGAGITVRYGAQDTRIGTDGSNDAFNSYERNVISGNSWVGIQVTTPYFTGQMPEGGLTTDGTIIAGNYIGVNAAGNAPLGNASAGIYAPNMPTNLRIGTNSDGVADDEERNVVSGNNGVGIQVEGWSYLNLLTTDQLIAGTIPSSTVSASIAQADFSDPLAGHPGNWGFDNPIPGAGGDRYAFRATGTLAVLASGTYSFAVSSDDAGRLRINGNDVVGDISGHPFTDVIGSVELGVGNHEFEWVGYEAGGSAAFELSVAVGSVASGSVTEANGWRVLGANNPHPQIALQGLIDATVYYPDPGHLNMSIAGNYIGTDPTGALDFGNAIDGIRLQWAAEGVTVGGDSPAERNLISGNNGSGVYLLHANTADNWLAGNYIGVTASGSAGLGNNGNGILLSAAQGNWVGTNGDGLNDAAEGNVISASGGSGVQVYGNRQTVDNLYIADQLIAGKLERSTAIGSISQADLRDQVDGPNGNWSFNNPVPGGGGDEFVIVATGSFDVAQAGDYSFSLGGDDGGRLLIDGNPIVVDDSTHGFLEYFGTASLSAGTHTFEWVMMERWFGSGWELAVKQGVFTSGPANAANGWAVLGAPEAAVTLDGAIDLTVYYAAPPPPSIPNVIAGNRIGTNAGGTAALGNTASGIRILNGAQGTRVGTDGDGIGDLEERNVISGNINSGIEIFGDQTSHSIIAGNYIGTDANGTADLGNTRDGILIWQAAHSNVVGSDGSDDAFNANERNVISGNDRVGIYLYGVQTRANIVAGNFIGTDVFGTSQLGNADRGILLAAGASQNRIGTDGNGLGDIAERNLISANAIRGLEISDVGTDANTIAGNYIGTDVSGTLRLGNLQQGLRVGNGAQDTIVGTNGDGIGDAVEGNVVAASQYVGIIVAGSGTDRTVIAGNFVGTDKSGTVALGNGGNGGLRLTAGAASTRVGTNWDGISDELERNVIAANLNDGIEIDGVGTDYNLVAGNYIGINATGDAALGNTVNGVQIRAGAQYNLVGGASSIARNVISGNLQFGIDISDSGTSFNHVLGNYVGTNAAGSAAVPNLLGGVRITSAATENTIGTNGDGIDDAQERNLISGNALSGVGISGLGTDRNTVAGNLIGTDATGSLPMGNGTVTNMGSSMGLAIADGAQHNRVGTDGDGISDIAERNVISGNVSDGIKIFRASFNTVAGNYIGINQAGSAGLGNGRSGVFIQLDAQHNRVGSDGDGNGDLAERNVISANASHGVHLASAGTTHNIIAGNLIGTNAAGTIANANGMDGVRLDAGVSQSLVGGTLAAARNVISGNLGNGVSVVEAGPGNRIQGNYIGTDVSGSQAVGNSQASSAVSAGVLLFNMNGQTVVVGTNGDGVADSFEGNVISGNYREGLRIQGGNNDLGLHVVAGNKIGVNVSGTSVLPNQGHGLGIFSSSNNRIGTNADGLSDELERNIIAGNRNLGGHPDGPAVYASGIAIVDEDANDGLLATGNLIAGNSLGTDASGALALGNQAAGIRVERATNTVIGSNSTAGENLIYFGGDDGIEIFGTGEQGVTAESSTSVLLNRFRANAGLAIDIGPDGTTLNDQGDADGVLNFPILTSATIAAGELTIRGFVSPGRSFELYTASAESGAPFGEGQSLVGTFTESSNADADASSGVYGPSERGVTVASSSLTENAFEFTMPLPAGVGNGSLLTARSLGSTSEFSPLLIAGEQTSVLAPVITLASQATLDVGGRLQLDGSFADADSTLWTATVDYGDGSGVQPMGLSANRTFGLDHVFAVAGNYSVVVQITDNSLATGEAILQVAVNSVAPQVEFTEFVRSTAVEEGQEAFLGGPLDPNAVDTVRIDWGDGSVDVLTSFSPTDTQFFASHVYLDDTNDQNSASAEDVYQIVVELSGPGGTDQTQPGLLPVQVRNVRPHTLVVSPSANSLIEGETLVLSGSFVDPGVLDTHKVLIDWGDGNTVTHTLPAGVTDLSQLPIEKRSHTYLDDQALNEDEYTVRVQVTDDDEPDVLSAVSFSQVFAVVNARPSSVNFSVENVSEGGTVTISGGSFSDSGPNDTHRVFVDWGDGGSESVLDLPAGQLTFGTLTHVYANDPAGNAEEYMIAVRVADNDEPTFSGELIKAVTVSNANPVLESVLLMKGTTVLLPGEAIQEGDSVTVSGSYTDMGLADRHRVMIDWGDGKPATAASVDSILRTFSASYTYGDNFGPANVTVSVQDGRFIDGSFTADGGSDSASMSLLVNNVSPEVFIAPTLTSTPTAVTLVAQISDPGFDDTFVYTWSFDGVPITDDGDPAADRLLFDSTVFTSPPRIAVTVQDDDQAIGTFEVFAVFGTDNPETLGVRADGFTRTITAGQTEIHADDLSVDIQPLPLGSNILVMGFAGEDFLDASALSADYTAILDGGLDTDYLKGGAGQDVFFAHAGDDTVDGGAGDDTFLLKPNSTLTVIDTSGENVLDFSQADFGDSTGINFDLSLISDNVFEPARQIVSDSGGVEHVVDARGSFTRLVGSQFSDTLTATSGSTILAGAGRDVLKISADLTDATIRGGADDDVFSVDVGVTVSGLNFGGDEGVDLFENLGTIGQLTFSGGADDDVFINALGGTISGLSFGGDDGLDTLTNLGTIVDLQFTGGADDDVFINEVNATINGLNFGGDEGADIFTNLGTVSNLTFTGGADDDVFINQVNATISGLNFGGDDGADIFRNFGEISGSLVFTGGADDDIFINELGGVISGLNFGGDDGADLFTNLGNISALTFSGGADDDVFLNEVQASISGLNFGGDEGADLFVNLGSVTSLVFSGGADDDVFLNELGATVTGLNFGGDEGADVFNNRGTLTNLVFSGGADDDLFNNDVGAVISGLNFGGDEGADVFHNLGTLTNLVFSGGADDDLFNNGVGGVISGLSFGGDEGADVFQNLGTLTDLTFTGGADDDLFISTGELTGDIRFFGDMNPHQPNYDAALAGNDTILISGSASISVATTLSFDGGRGRDTLLNNATGFASIVFLGGADDDVFVNNAEGIGQINFGGDEGADIFENNGSNLLSLVFHGGADDDVFINTGENLASLVFNGDAQPDGQNPEPADDGADFLQNVGTVIQLTFTGGADDDIFNNLGTVTELTFNGGADDDIFVNLGSVVDLQFSGGADDDVFQNDGQVQNINFGGDAGADILLNYGGFASLVFTGGADDDIFANYGELVGEISFNGDMDPAQLGYDPTIGGNDTFILRGSGDGQVSTSVLFHGGKGNDSFQNNAGGFHAITFQGGADDDVFQNNADSIGNLHFGGDEGSDIFENNGASVSSLVFSGGADDDVFINDGARVTSLVFQGGADDDLFVNTGTDVFGLNFGGDEGADVLLNTGSGLIGVVFSGGADDDVFINEGPRLEGLNFGGDQGNDRFWNKAGGVGSSGLTFSGDEGADIFINDAAAVVNLVFNGGADDDGFQNNGAAVSLVFINGAEGNDRVINTGGLLGSLYFSGGSGDDSFGNRGFDAGRLEMTGDDGADLFLNEGLGTLELVFSGGADDDVFTNLGSVAELTFVGGADDDVLQNNGSIGDILFAGDDGSDLFQNNGPAIQLTFSGGADDDIFINNADDVRAISFGGDDGLDTFINNGNSLGSVEFFGGGGGDYLRLLGKGIGNVHFVAGSGNDTFEYNAVASTGSQVTFDAGPGDDFLAWLGSADSALFYGGSGNDMAFVVGAGQLSLDGQAGNDSYTVVGNPLMSLVIGEHHDTTQDSSVDSLDFSAFTGGPLAIDLRSTLPQQQSSQFVLTLADGLGIENVVGTPFGDTILGNERDNVLYGAQYFSGFEGPVAEPRGETQWVFLDFDSRTNTGTQPDGLVDAGEYVYSPVEREQIVRRIESVYRGPDAGAAWFDVRITQDVQDIPTGVDFVTIYFNDTPEFGRPGGLASEVDLGNQNFGGTAQVQINGLLGGAVTAEEASLDVTEASYPGEPTVSHATLFGDSQVGSLKPDATSQNFVLLSSKIAAHELGHLMGLRHQDSFGPIGYGIHDPPGGDAYNPVYTGPAGGFESFDHLSGSPASIGSSRFTDLNDLFFGEREAIKLAFANSRPEDTLTAEVGSHASLEAAQPIVLVNLAVPNTLAAGANSAKSFFVQLQSVAGRIALDATSGQSESDFYSFTGKAGELVNIDVLSNSLVGRLGSAPDDYVDTILRVYDENGTLVPYNGGVAVNDDQFEPTDSSLVDLKLPADGTYYIEIDTFRRDASDPNYAAAIAARDQLIERRDDQDPANDLILAEAAALSRLVDTLEDTDVGGYQMVVYRFANANRGDAIDNIKGNGGVDEIYAGADENYELSFDLGEVADLEEGDTFSRTVQMSDRGASSWSGTVDYGDGSPPEALSFHGSFDQGLLSFDLRHVYADNDADERFTLTVTISNDIGQQTVQTLEIGVSNIAPVVAAASNEIQATDGLDPVNQGSFSDVGSDAISITASVGTVIQDSASGTWSWSYDVSQSTGETLQVTITAQDDDQATSEVTFTVIFSKPPVPSLTVPIDGVQALASQFTFTATDPDVENGLFEFLIDWGDGTPRQQVSALAVNTSTVSVTVPHVYEDVSASGLFVITVVATDPRGVSSTLATSAEFAVQGWSILLDADNSPILVVVGSQGDDDIKIKDRREDRYKIKINDREEDAIYKGTIYGAVSRVLVHGLGGADTITLDDNIELGASIWGGLGNDKIKAGEGDDLVLGEAGDDTIFGGKGRDILIGGTGADKIHGDQEDDVLIAGYTAFENEFNWLAPERHQDRKLDHAAQRLALEAILREWSSDRTIEDRRSNIWGRHSATFDDRHNRDAFLTFTGNTDTDTVFDDTEKDTLWGNEGIDWYFANVLVDDIKDLKDDLDDSDMWWL